VFIKLYTYRKHELPITSIPDDEGTDSLQNVGNSFHIDITDDQRRLHHIQTP
jgi:hypothetical protein